MKRILFTWFSVAAAIFVSVAVLRGAGPVFGPLLGLYRTPLPAVKPAVDGKAGCAPRSAADPLAQCHPAEVKEWAGTKHAAFNVTCPLCHGEATTHAQTGRGQGVIAPRRLSFEQGVYLCGRCHDLRQFRRSQHYQIKVLDCFSCHPAHTLRPARGDAAFCGASGCHPDAARGWIGHRDRLELATCGTCHLPVTKDLRTGQAGVNHTLRPRLARDVLLRLTKQ